MAFWKLNNLLLQLTCSPIQWTTLFQKIMSVFPPLLFVLVIGAYIFLIFGLVLHGL